MFKHLSLHCILDFILYKMFALSVHRVILAIKDTQNLTSMDCCIFARHSGHSAPATMTSFAQAWHAHCNDHVRRLGSIRLLITYYQQIA